MFDASDPRLSLQGETAARAGGRAPARPQCFEFASMEPDEWLESGTKTWLVRSRNLILAYSQARRGTVFTRTDQPDEYTILLPSPMTRATIRTADAAMDVSGEAIVVVSADSSELSIQSDEYPAAGPSDGMPGGRAQR